MADPMLVNVVERVDSGDLSPLWVTLLLSGTWCTGQLVGRAEWTEIALRAVEGRPVYLAVFGDYQRYDGVADHVHLLEAKTFEGAVACPAAGTLLRLRIDEVSGWALGRMAAQPS